MSNYLNMIENKEYSISTILQPHQLTQNYSATLLLEARKKLEKTCTKDYGYILKVEKLNKVGPGFISKVNGSMKCDISVMVDVLKPEIGQTYIAVIEHIMPSGIICLIEGIMRCCILTPDAKKFSVNEEITVRIIEFRFENRQIRCVGELVV